MAKTVFTGWDTITPGKCFLCGFDEYWVCDGRGNVLCECQACPDCGIIDAYGFHNPGCPQLEKEMARTFYSQNLQMLRGYLPHMEEAPHPDEEYRSVYLGSYMSLDPCGRYHHCLSPNGATSRCQAFWEALEKAADKLGGWIEGGEGDPTDIYFCMPADEEESE